MEDEVLKIIVVEDQRLFQQLLSHISVNQFGYELVGVAEDGLEALRLCRENQVDLLLLDLLIPKMSGLVVAAILREEYPSLKIIAISSEMDPFTIHQVFEIGFNGFIDKGTQNIEALTEGIRAVSEGKRFFTPKIIEIRDHLLNAPQAFPKILSPREQEILALIGGCYSDAEIGEKVGLAQSTVQTHRRNIMNKVSVHSTPELIRYALEQGFWKPHEARLNDPADESKMD